MLIDALIHLVYYPPCADWYWPNAGYHRFIQSPTWQGKRFCTLPNFWTYCKMYLQDSDYNNPKTVDLEGLRETKVDASLSRVTFNFWGPANNLKFSWITLIFKSIGLLHLYYYCVYVYGRNPIHDYWVLTIFPRPKIVIYWHSILTSNNSPKYEYSGIKLFENIIEIYGVKRVRDTNQ